MADSLLPDIAGDLQLTAIDLNLVLYIVGIIVIAYLLVYMLSHILVLISERVGHHRTSIAMIIPLLKILIYAFAIYYIVAAILQPSFSQMIAFAGLFGAAVGIGLKDIFLEIVGGLVIILEKPYQIGDMVTLGNSYGEVKDIGLRSTKLRTPADELVSVPNDTIFTQPVNSGNAGDIPMMILIDLFIHAESDASLAAKILREALVTSKYVIVSQKYPYTVLIENFPLYTRVRAKGYVCDLRLEFEFKSEVTRRTLAEFRRLGIESPVCFPFPEGIVN